MVKQRLTGGQTPLMRARRQERRFKGVGDVIVKTWRHEGVVGFYKVPDREMGRGFGGILGRGGGGR